MPSIDWQSVVKATIDKAILAENERCAKIAEDEAQLALTDTEHEGSDHATGYVNACFNMATIIRSLR